MEKIVTIGDKEIKMRSSGATPIKYQTMFHRDLFVDMKPLFAGMKVNADGTSSIPMEAIEVFTRLAYDFACQGDPEMNTSFEDWLEQFEMMDMMTSFTDILDLWNIENLTHATAKKKNGRSTGR